jgi:hypothetical protein
MAGSRMPMFSFIPYSPMFMSMFIFMFMAVFSPSTGVSVREFDG